MQEWLSRAAKMNEMSQGVNKLFQHLSSCNNRELLYDLYSYVWDIRGVISLLNSYIKWLGKREIRRCKNIKFKYKNVFNVFFECGIVL